MPLRILGNMFAGRRLLLSIQQGIISIMQGIDDLKTADAAEATAIAAALATIKTLAEQHQADLEQLAAQASAGADLSGLVSSMQARAKSLTDAVAAVQAQVPAPGAAGTTTAAPGATGATGDAPPQAATSAEQQPQS